VVDAMSPPMRARTLIVPTLVARKAAMSARSCGTIVLADYLASAKPLALAMGL